MDDGQIVTLPGGQILAREYNAIVRALTNAMEREHGLTMEDMFRGREAMDYRWSNNTGSWVRCFWGRVANGDADRAMALAVRCDPTSALIRAFDGGNPLLLTIFDYWVKARTMVAVVKVVAPPVPVEPSGASLQARADKMVDQPQLATC